MSSNKGKGIFRTLFRPKISCGCNNPKLTDIISPGPKPKASAQRHDNQMMLTNPLSSSSGSWERNGSTSRDQDDEAEKEDYTSTTFSLTSLATSSEESGNLKNRPNTPSKAISSQSVLGDSIAVEKHSYDPYADFQQSILQMIVQKKIYSKSDLQELVNCFLQLNSPLHHQTIIKAFTDLLDNTTASCNINATPHRSRNIPMKELKDSSCNS